ncbi:hypothetical protein V8E54_004158 [Elaphomyces granulatus]|jgi:hypothetical protein
MYSTSASIAANWRKRGADPEKKLAVGLDPDAYGPWRYDIDLKLEDGSPMYQTDTLSQLDQPLFSTMKAYVAENRLLTLDALWKKRVVRLLT